MAKPKKGQLAQFLIPMVDATDFASVESGITESDFNSGATRKFYGWNHGVSTATTSGSISKTASLVRSGVFRLTLKGSENNYDNMMVRVNKTGTAEQILTWENVDNDDSDIMSALTVIQSMASDAASAAQQGNSRTLLNQSRISDIASFLVVMSGIQSDLYSLVSDLNSNLFSRIPGEPASRSQLSDIGSDLRSYLTGMSGMLSDTHSAATAGASRALLNQSRVSDVYSLLSDFESNFGSRIPKEPAARSQLSDAHSDIISALGNISVTLTTSDISDIASAVIANLPGLNASDISDIASAVQIILSDTLSNIYSAAVQGSSRILVNESMTSDIYSLLSDLNSNFGSRIPKEPAARSQLSDLSSDLASDLKSFIGAGISLDASTMSDIRSAITAAEFDASDVSDIASAVQIILSDTLSNILSAALQGASRALINQSRISDVQSYLAGVSGSLSDVESQIDAGVPINASGVSDIASRVFARTISEPAAGSVFAFAAGRSSFDDLLSYWAALSRNEIDQTSAVRSLRNDADNDNLTSFAVSDDGTTFVDGEAS